MFWNLPIPPIPPPIVMFYEYRLTEQGTSLWHQTKDTDLWYQAWFYKLAQQTFSHAEGGVEIKILDHNDKLLGKCLTLKPKKLEGPP